MTEKPESRKTITIKINGKDRPFQNKESKMQSAEQKDSKKSETANPLPDRSVEEVAAGSEAIEDESFDWILPNEDESDDIKEFQLQQAPNKKQGKLPKKMQKGSKRNLSKGMVASIFFAVFFAIVLGTGFGFVLLKMVDTDKTANAVNNSAAPTQAAGTDSKEQAASGTIAATKGEISTFVVQYGVYTTKASADSEFNKLSDKGIIAQKVPVDGKTAIYLGVAADLDSAKTLKTDKEADGVAPSPYAKEMIFAGGDAGKVSEAEKQFLDAAPEIYSAASSALTSAYADGSISADTVKKLEEQQSALDKLKISDFKDGAVKNAAENLAGSVSGAAALSKDGGAAKQEAVQKALLAFLANYVEIGS
ncbi:hypothetical protein CEQ21_18380 [Niallia circulans]|uniref:SPOR domain-containing protein n=1 Tax=Niallia circulans TaxID=1397 RepID=A0A553SKD3_NIACI|nr:hypothetical protein [Niallia circulans]TRZ37419.1 hypothetical protein CEQ21_18380 [Niallia circulans]